MDKRILLIPTSIYFLEKEFVESVTSQPAESLTNQCVTDNTNSSCILPFKVDGILHDRCLPDLNTGKYWCPTSVNQEQEYVAGTSKWGFCSQSCPPLNEKFGNTIKKEFSKQAKFASRNTAWKGTYELYTHCLL